MYRHLSIFIFSVSLMLACGPSRYSNQSTSISKPHFNETLIRGGTVYDGSAKKPVVVDIRIVNGKISTIGSDLKASKTTKVIDATGLTIAPGFINVLSWSSDELLMDGSGLSVLKQGVTTEIFGEGWSMGPWNAAQKAAHEKNALYDYKVTWTTLAEYLERLKKQGVSFNIASTVGASTVRENILGGNDVQPTKKQLEEMKKLVADAMREGALGLSTALPYVPGTYAKTPEIVALAKVAASYGGMYASHIRSEGNDLENAIDEFLTVAREANIRSQIHHLKMAGTTNWEKFKTVSERLQAATKEGLNVTFNVYPYTHANIGLAAILPPWVREGGNDSMIRRLQDENLRNRIATEINENTSEWENFYTLAGGPSYVWPITFRNENLRKFASLNLVEIAKRRTTTPAGAAMDLLVENGTNIGTLFRLASDENINKQLSLPLLCGIGTDESAVNLSNKVFERKGAHPRGFGAFPRILRKYVREDKTLSMERAIYSLTGCPATFYGIEQAKRGYLREGYHADIVVFDAATIADTATYEKPKQYAIGVKHLFVNGVAVLENGNYTKALPGEIIHGPGYEKGQIK